MTTSPEGCGIAEHPVTCLCDVVITEPIVADYPVIPYQIKAGVALAHYGKWDGTLQHWLELSRFAWDQIHKYRAEQEERNIEGILPNRPTTIPYEAYEYLRMRVAEGAMPGPVLAELWERFGVKISKSYVSKTRARMREKGEL